MGLDFLSLTVALVVQLHGDVCVVDHGTIKFRQVRPDDLHTIIGVVPSARLDAVPDKELLNRPLGDRGFPVEPPYRQLAFGCGVDDGAMLEQESIKHFPIRALVICIIHDTPYFLGDGIGGIGVYLVYGVACIQEAEHDYRLCKIRLVEYRPTLVVEVIVGGILERGGHHLVQEV
jgi:hypothetical protein